MKSCPMCGTDAEGDAAACERCSYTFSSSRRDPALPEIQARTRSSSLVNVHEAGKRPSGQVPIAVGWTCCVVAVVLLLLALWQSPERWGASTLGDQYTLSGVNRDLINAYARQWLYQVAAGAFFSMFMVFWSVGYIVRAISFLPSGERP
jgi:hypothetical protein